MLFYKLRGYKKVPKLHKVISDKRIVNKYLTLLDKAEASNNNEDRHKLNEFLRPIIKKHDFFGVDPYAHHEFDVCSGQLIIREGSTDEWGDGYKYVKET